MERKKGKRRMWALVLAVAVLLAALLTFGLLRHFTPHFPPPIAAAPAGTVRVACVGDSLTYGMLLWNRAHSCYPARLQTLLGDGYAVRNFAANSQTVLHTADRPYINHKLYRESGDFLPDIVFIMMGSNDAKKENWTNADAFSANFRALVAHYQSLPSSPAVYVMTVPTVFPARKDGTPGYNVVPGNIPAIAQAQREVAGQLGAAHIDVHEMTRDRRDYFVWLDGVHPNAKGAQAIAEMAYEALQES